MFPNKITPQVLFWSHLDLSHHWFVSACLKPMPTWKLKVLLLFGPTNFAQKRLTSSSLAARHSRLLVRTRKEGSAICLILDAFEPSLYWLISLWHRTTLPKKTWTEKKKKHKSWISPATKSNQIYLIKLPSCQKPRASDVAGLTSADGNVTWRIECLVCSSKETLWATWNGVCWWVWQLQ